MRKKAVKAKLSSVPHFIPPQLAKLTESIPRQGKWIFERKIDGYRIMARIVDGKVTLLSRSAKDWTAKFPHIANSLAELIPFNAYLDGEIVAFTGGHGSAFQTLQNSLNDGPQAALAYYIFDALWLEADLRQLPLLERKQLLRTFCFSDEAAKGPLYYLPHETGDAADLFEQSCQKGNEGIVCKRADSPYFSGRSPTWLKIKCSGNEEFVVGGFTLLKDQPTHIGALLLGQYDEDGRFEYCGRVGTGFSTADRGIWYRELTTIRRSLSPFSKRVRVPGAIWVNPVVVAQVGFTERTADGLLRHPRFLGIREDKGPMEVQHEQSQPAH